MADSYEVFEGKTLSDVFKDIYVQTRKKTKHDRGSNERSLEVCNGYPIL